MKWCKEHWYAAVLAIALVVAAVVANRDARDQSAEIQQRNYENCLVASPRTAYTVAFTRAAANARRATGDPFAGDQYDALAAAQTATILAPKGYEGSPQLVQVTFERTLPDGPLRARLTDRSMALLKEGCRRAYGP